jgi:hypothetical protein
MEKLDRLEQFRLKLRKWFPATKDMTDKQLVKEVKSNRRLQLIMLGMALMFASFFAFVPNFKLLSSVEQMAFIGVITAGIALSFGVYAQYHILEAEANFELRVREAVAEVKALLP